MCSGVTFDGSAWQGYSTGADDLSVTLILFLTPTEGLSFVSEPFDCGRMFVQNQLLWSGVC